MFAGVDTSFTRERLRSATAVAILHALLGYALVTGFAVAAVRDSADPLKLFRIIEPPPPPPVEKPLPARARSAAEEGAAAPENLKSKASPVVAPAVPIERPNPVIAAPLPASGRDPGSGAADRPGPGTGAGGSGKGSGSGDSGDGSGAGAASPARLLRGRIVNSDYPRSAWRDRNEGSVTVHLDVGADGRVTGCRVARSSGNGELDSTTCRLIRQRFRYEPARDSAGRPIASVMGWRQTWWLE